MSPHRYHAFLTGGMGVALPTEGTWAMHVTTRMFNGLGTTNVMTVASDSPGQSGLLRQAERVVRSLDDAWSLFKPTSLVTRLNRDGRLAHADADTLAVLALAAACSRDTDGCFDITTTPANALWKQAIAGGAIPGSRELDAVLPLVDHTQVRVDGSTVTLGACQQVDLGGIAKGYVLDRLQDLLTQAGVRRAVINLGGSVRVIGRAQVQIRNPFCPVRDANLAQVPAAPIVTLDVTDASVVTSGVYEQGLTTRQGTFHHILDPRTCRPTGGDLRSVTLVGERAGQLDAYATAAFAMDLGALLALIASHGIEAVLITQDGSVHATDTIKSHLRMGYHHERVA